MDKMNISNATIKFDDRELPLEVISGTENEQAIAARFGIQSIPTLALFRNGREIARQPGAMGAGDIVRWTESSLRA